MPLLRLRLKPRRPFSKYICMLHTDIRGIAPAIIYSQVAHLSIQVFMGADLYSPISTPSRTPLSQLLRQRRQNLPAIKILAQSIDISKLHQTNLLVGDSSHSPAGLAIIIACGAKDNTDLTTALLRISADMDIKSMALLMTFNHYTPAAMARLQHLYKVPITDLSEDDDPPLTIGVNLRVESLRHRMYSFTRQTCRRWSVFD